MNRVWGVVVIIFMVCCVFAAHFYFAAKEPIVSVVMSTYNRADKLKRVIESVLNQTFDNFEFIIVNDGSTDGTREVLRSYQKRDKRIILVENKENRGLIYSLNRGLALARGKYIARIDDDDEMLTRRLSRQTEYMEQHPEAAVLCTGYYAYKNQESESGETVRRRVRIGCPSPAEQVYINLHFANGIAHSTTMLRRSFLEEKGLSYHADYKSAEDYKLWTDVVRNKGEIHCLKEPLTEYTRAGDNPSSFYRNMVSSSKQVRMDILSDFFEHPEEIIKQSKCDVLKQMALLNTRKKILDQNRLENEVNRNCPPDNQVTWKTVHPNWNDYLIFTDDGRSVYRFLQPKERASVISFNGNELVLKWEKWRPERFICDRQKRECHLKGVKNGTK